MLNPEEKVALETIKSVAEFINNFKQLPYNKKNAFAIQLLLITLAEAARTISQPIKDMYKSMPWQALTSLRTSLSKRWHSVDLQKLFPEAIADIPKLAKTAAAILKEENNAMMAFSGSFMPNYIADSLTKLTAYRTKQKQKKQKIVAPSITIQELIRAPYTKDLQSLGRIVEQTTNIDEFLQDDQMMQSPITMYAVGMAMTIIGLCVEQKITSKFKINYPLNVPTSDDPLSNITWDKLETYRKDFMHEGYNIQYYLVYNSAYFYSNNLKNAIQTIEYNLNKKIILKEKVLIYVYEADDVYRISKKILEYKYINLLKPTQGAVFFEITDVADALAVGDEFLQTSKANVNLMLIKLFAHNFITMMVKRVDEEKVDIFAIISSTIDHLPDISSFTQAITTVYPQAYIKQFPQLQNLTQIRDRDILVILMTNLTDLASSAVKFDIGTGLSFVKPDRNDIAIGEKRLLHQEASVGFLAKQVSTLNAQVWAKAWAQVALWLKLGITDTLTINKLIPYILSYVFPEELATSSEIAAGELVEIKEDHKLLKGFAGAFFNKSESSNWSEKIQQNVQQQNQIDSELPKQPTVEHRK